MFKFIVLWLSFLISLAFPPLLLITTPLLIMGAVRWIRVQRFRRETLRRGLETHNLLSVGKAFRSK